jgi:hypothetical protein
MACVNSKKNDKSEKMLSVESIDSLINVLIAQNNAKDH